MAGVAPSGVGKNVPPVCIIFVLVNFKPIFIESHLNVFMNYTLCICWFDVYITFDNIAFFSVVVLFFR